MNGYFIAAGIASALVCGLHVVGGGREVAVPLLRSEMPDVPKYLNYYCWHIVTLLLASMAVSYGYAAVYPSGVELAVLMTFLAFSMTVWCLGLIVWKRQRFWQMPQWFLFAIITGTALPGLAWS